MPREVDFTHIKVMNDTEAAALRAMGGTMRLKMVDELCRAGILLMAANVRRQNPDWSPEQVDREVARRVSDAAA